METWGYLHSALCYEANASELRDDLKRVRKPYQAPISLKWVSLLTLLAVLSVSGQAWAAIRMGDRGEEVRSLQTRLATLGLYQGSTDGVFGSRTKEAVMQFQRQQGLQADGIVGQQTLAALESAASATHSTNPPGLDVVRLQTLLRDRGFYQGDIDGDYGSQTQAAVVAAQTAYNLTPDGVPGSQTLAALQAGPPPSSTGGPAVPVGDGASANNLAISDLQQRLKDRGFYSGEVDDVFGPQTEAAIKAFQAANNLTPDGIPGPQTIALLQSGQPSQPAGGSTGSGTPQASPVVREIQKLLADLKLYGGDQDGIFGDRTEAALRAALRQNGLPPTSPPTQETLEALRSKIAAGS